ncbi:MAG: hypothetical protein MUF64_29675, partial [Polyangiaceae bacterium]|nr:hypothetical protein [Polyangiaceae bacterium]
RQLLAGLWMATDGTGLKVLVPGLPEAHDGYIEPYRNGEISVLQYEPTKDGDKVEAKLKPFRGTLTADAGHRFNGVSQAPIDNSATERECRNQAMSHGGPAFSGSDARTASPGSCEQDGRQPLRPPPAG